MPYLSSSYTVNRPGDQTIKKDGERKKIDRTRAEAAHSTVDRGGAVAPGNFNLGNAGDDPYPIYFHLIEYRFSMMHRSMMNGPRLCSPTMYNTIGAIVRKLSGPRSFKAPPFFQPPSPLFSPVDSMVMMALCFLQGTWIAIPDTDCVRATYYTI